MIHSNKGEMTLRSIIIGMMVFVLFLSSMFYITTDMYSIDNLNINLSNDTDTEGLGDLQETIETKQQEIQNNNDYIQKRTVGGNETNFDRDIQEGDLISSSWQALTQVPSYINIFFDLLNAVVISLSGAIGVTISGMMWFFMGLLVIIVSFILISSVLQRKV